MQNLNPTSSDLLAALNEIIRRLKEDMDSEIDDACACALDDTIGYAEHSAKWHALHSTLWDVANVLGMVARDTLRPEQPLALLDLIQYANPQEYEDVLQSL